MFSLRRPLGLPVFLGSGLPDPELQRVQDFDDYDLLPPGDRLRRLGLPDFSVDEHLARGGEVRPGRADLPGHAFLSGERMAGVGPDDEINEKDEDERENAIPEAPKRLRTTPGTLWKLGEHRLLCGDSRHKKTWNRLLGRTKVDHIFAGPPHFNQRAYSHWDDYAEYLRDMDAVMARCHAALKDGGIAVWNIGNGSSTNHAHVVHHAGLLEENGFRFVDMIIWFKSAPNFGIPRHVNIKKHRLYYPSHQWEAIHIYQKPGKMPVMSPEGVTYLWEHATDVWKIPAVRDQIQMHSHPAVCPVEIPFRTILAYTDEGATVLDPFGGSGTTLIAAERTGRRAFLVEKSSEYCDQIVKRWEEFTHKRARRILSDVKGSEQERDE